MQINSHLDCKFTYNHLQHQLILLEKNQQQYQLKNKSLRDSLHLLFGLTHSYVSVPVVTYVCLYLPIWCAWYWNAPLGEGHEEEVEEKEREETFYANC